MRLGEGFRLPVVEEPTEHLHVPTADDIRNEQLLVALAALQDALVNLPRPEVHVEAPDLTAIVQAVTALKPGATSEDIAGAVVRQLSPATPQTEVSEVLGKLVKALERLDFRMQGSGTGGSVALASSDITDRASRQIGEVTVKNDLLTAAQLVASITHTPTRTRDGLSYYSSGDGGRVAFNVSTDILSISGSGEQPLAAFRNPAASGIDVVLFFGEFSSSINTSFRRYRGATITPTGTKRDAANMGGGTATSKAELYVGGATPAYTGTGGIVSKTAQIGAFAQYVANINGSVRLRPGQGIRWTITGPGGNPSYSAAVYLEYAEIPAMA